MENRFLLTATLFLGIIFGGVASDLFASAVDDVRLLNEQMSDARRNGQPTHLLAKTASALLSSETLRLNLEHYVSDVGRNIAQDTIFNKVIGDFHQGRRRFSLKERSQTNDPLDSYYIAHMGFIALNHLAALNLLTQKASFLYDEKDHVHTLLENRITLFDQYIKIKNNVLSQTLRTLIGDYSNKDITRILGNRVQDRYLGLCRNYPDVKAQWLIQVKDIQEKRPSRIMEHTDLNQDKYFDVRKELIAINFKNTDDIPVSFLEKCVHYKSHYLISSEKAFENLSKQQNPWAQFNLAIMYENGQGAAKFLSQDQQENMAFELYQKAAHQNYAIAQLHLAGMYENGQGAAKFLSQDQQENMAFELYQKAAHQNNALAQFSCAAMYESGEGPAKGLPQDQLENQAFEWHQKAARQNYAPAQYNLAFMYENGEGDAKYLSQAERENIAFEWYQKAADQNFAIAQLNCATLYFKGAGTQKNWQKSLDLYKESASNGLCEEHIHINIAVLESFFNTLKSKDLLIDAIATQLTQQQCFDFCRSCGIRHFVDFDPREDYKTIFINSNAISEKEAFLYAAKTVYLLGIKKEDGQLNNSLYSVIGKYMAAVSNRLTGNVKFDLDAGDASQVAALFDFFIQEGLLTPAEANIYREDLFPSD